MLKNSKVDQMFLCNPDVVLREEDEDGGLLFNPDTNQVKVINTTGLFIWKQCNQSNNFQSIVENLRKSFDEVPETMVAEDIDAFLSEMIGTGFIGTVLSE
jgi:hypothetical protein